jgi:hypothetical protein
LRKIRVKTSKLFALRASPYKGSKPRVNFEQFVFSSTMAILALHPTCKPTGLQLQTSLAMEVLENVAKVYRCEICDRKFNSPKQLRAHRKARPHQNKVRELPAGGAGPAADGRILDGDGCGRAVDGRIDDGWTSWQDQLDQQADPACSVQVSRRIVSVQDSERLDDGWGGVKAEEIGVDRNDGWGGLVAAPAGPEAAAAAHGFAQIPATVPRQTRQADWTDSLHKI